MPLSPRATVLLAINHSPVTFAPDCRRSSSLSSDDERAAARNKRDEMKKEEERKGHCLNGFKDCLWMIGLFCSKLSYWIGESQTDKTVFTLRRSAKEGKHDLKAITWFDNAGRKGRSRTCTGRGRNYCLDRFWVGWILHPFFLWPRTHMWESLNFWRMKYNPVTT